MAETSVSRIARGIAAPQLGTAFQIAAALGCRVDEVFSQSPATA